MTGKETCLLARIFWQKLKGMSKRFTDPQKVFIQKIERSIERRVDIVPGVSTTGILG
jgi:hypothetical protein